MAEGCIFRQLGYVNTVYSNDNLRVQPLTTILQSYTQICTGDISIFGRVGPVGLTGATGTTGPTGSVGSAACGTALTIISNRQPQDNPGGDGSTGSWTGITASGIMGNGSNVSLTGGSFFTLGPGGWYLRAFITANQSENFMARFFNQTLSTVLTFVDGTPAYSTSEVIHFGFGNTLIEGYVILTQSTLIQIQVRGNWNFISSINLGYASANAGFDEVEIYMSLFIERVS